MAIILPHEMDFTGEKFSMIISGPPGVGKTTLALSAPNPVLIDFDKGLKRVKAKHRKAAVQPSTYEEALEVINGTDIKGYDTIVIDTLGSQITYTQDWAMRQNPANRQKNGAISLKGFGAVKAEYVRLTNYIKYTLQKHVVYVIHTVEQRDGDITKQRLLCEGAARDIVWQPCDLGGFLHIIGGNRMIGFSPTEEYFAKGCFGVEGVLALPALENDAPNDFLTLMFAQMQQSLAEESQIYEEEKARYDAAIDAGHALVNGVIDVKTANAFADEFGALEHALTSKEEIRALFRVKIGELEMKWNNEDSTWEPKEPPAPEPTADPAPEEDADGAGEKAEEAEGDDTPADDGSPTEEQASEEGEPNEIPDNSVPAE